MKLTIFLIFVYALDDLILEILTFIYRSKPKKLTEEDLILLHSQKQKKLAIIIANWHESEILYQMVTGNLNRIDFNNYDIFLGVYPNDLETKQIAHQLAEEFQQVHVVTNFQNGPTSKGQMLNQIIRHILQIEISQKVRFDAVIMQDSEDIIHPLTLKLMNDQLNTYDFIQTPVLCMPESKALSVRGTYIDEFSESHLKDLILRSDIKAAVPSAGVGTCLSRLLIADLLNEQNGNLFNEKTLTEDYQLGLTAYELGFNSTFSAFFYQTQNGIEMVATRELFPNKLISSVRQKTRWTFGIAIQAWKQFGWPHNNHSFISNLTQNYFLWRDRRSLFNAPLTVMSFFVLVTYILFPTYRLELNAWAHLSLTALLILSFKLFRRGQVTYFIYGLSNLWALPLRWVLSTFINTWAGLRAINMALKEFSLGVVPQWDKTSHELPENFGINANLYLHNKEKALQESQKPVVERQLERQ